MNAIHRSMSAGKLFGCAHDVWEYCNDHGLEHAWMGSPAFNKWYRETNSRPCSIVSVTTKRGIKVAVLREKERYVRKTEDYTFYDVEFDGYSGKRVGTTFDDDGNEREYRPDEYGGAYDLPPSHMDSAWHEYDRCAYCGIVVEDGLCWDHIVPHSKGGCDGIHNRAPACSPCNLKKSAKLGWKTLDGRTGFYLDGTPGHLPQPMIQKRRRR